MRLIALSNFIVCPLPAVAAASPNEALFSQVVDFDDNPNEDIPEETVQEAVEEVPVIVETVEAVTVTEPEAPAGAAEAGTDQNGEATVVEAVTVQDEAGNTATVRQTSHCATPCTSSARHLGPGLLWSCFNACSNGSDSRARVPQGSDTASQLWVSKI